MRRQPESLDPGDREALVRKQESRDRDRRAVQSGATTWREMNRANAIGGSVVARYRPAKKLGFPG